MQVLAELVVGSLGIGIGCEGGNSSYWNSGTCVAKTKNSNQPCLDLEVFTTKIEILIPRG